MHTRPAGLAATGLLTASLIAGGAVGSAAGAVPEPARSPIAASAPAAAGDEEVRVGTFNIVNVTADRTSGDQRPWKQRRSGIVDHIVREHLDVVATQENNPRGLYTSRLVTGNNQFNDLKAGLNAGGRRYALTDTNYASNSLDNRIYYNTARLSLVSKGSMKYARQTSGKSPRSLGWAVLKVKATGKSFLVLNTHLDPYSAANQTVQWGELVSKVKELRGSLPVTVMGDFNTSKFKDTFPRSYDKMTAIGVPDALGQVAKGQLRPLRAKRTVNTWINSFNAFKRPVQGYADHTKVGNGVDWIFASSAIGVPEFELVADYDPTSLRRIGVLESDHYLLKATLRLP